ncbi:MAG: acetyl-CoA carboxylase biotin carboxyl carrier protein [Candidatus Omnitrophica bacterium]|nr:acetyl-CoA carboxylase biotin carboxyl carrier protein [Candidatus Omnitrophota bacterium]
MNIKQIQALAEIMNENNLTEVEIDHEGTKVRLIKKSAGAVEHQYIPMPLQQVASVNSSQGQPVSEAKPEVKPANKGTEVKAPMVGTFYRSSSPEADPYVRVGDMVKKGDVLCILEAMKMMNEVKSEYDGKIMEIPVENADPVEFGQTIFVIDTQL